MILAGAFLVLVVPFAAGREDEPEKVSLADLKTAILRKMVAAHAAAFAADKGHAAHAKALADHLGGAASVAGKLDYAFKDGKPSVLLDATKLELNSAEEIAIAAAVKNLVGYSLNKVAETSITDGDDKFTLAKADAKTLAGAVRVFWRAGPPPVDPSKILAARLAALAKELEALKKVEDRIAKLERDAPGVGKKLDDLAAQVKKITDSVKELEKLVPAIQKLEESIKKLEPLPAQIKALEGKAKTSDDQIKALTDRSTKQDKAIVDAAVALEKLRVDNAAALLKLRVETALALLKQRDDSAAARKQQRDEFVAVIKKLVDETNVAFQKQNDAVKVLTDKLARTDDRANAQAKQLQRADTERKKLDARLRKAEAILFPPVIQYQVVDRGYYTLAPSQNYGCFGECFPTLTPVWVPCPVFVPIPPKVEVPQPEQLDQPMKSTRPTCDSPALPDSSVPVSLTRTGSGGKTRVRTVRPVVPIYYTDGLKATDAITIYTRGVQLYHAGEFAAALARFDAAIRLDGVDARFWYFKSLCETALGDAADARKSLDRAVVLHLQGKPTAEKIGQALERIQGPARLQFREALDAQRVRR
jgi:tetratricopeptide (TPR) repeat protein